MGLEGFSVSGLEDGTTGMEPTVIGNMQSQQTSVIGLIIRPEQIASDTSPRALEPPSWACAGLKNNARLAARMAARREISGVMAPPLRPEAFCPPDGSARAQM